MKFSKALILLSSIVAVLSDGHNNASDSAKEHSSDDALVISTNLLLDEVSEEILIEVQAVHNSSIVPADAVYDITFEVVEKHGDEDDKIQAILGHMTDAVSELELIHAGESGSVSDILAEIMFKAYGSEAPTPAPTAKVTEATMIDEIKNKITDTTDSIAESAAGIINVVFNPFPTPGP